MRVPVRARMCSLNWPLSTDGKKSWPSHGYSRANDPSVKTKNSIRNGCRVVDTDVEQRTIADAETFEVTFKGELEADQGIAALLLALDGFLVMLLQQILGHGRHDRTRKQVRGEHGEDDRLCQRHKQILAPRR